MKRRTPYTLASLAVLALASGAHAAGPSYGGAVGIWGISPSNANAPCIIGMVNGPTDCQLPSSATISGNASNAAAGSNGAAIPSSSSLTAFANSSGNTTPVSPSNPMPVTGTISATNPSVAATAAPTPGSATLMGYSSGGNLTPWTGSVSVGNFPATQAVTGSVSLSGTPSVSVGNFPATQTVAGSVSITGTPSVSVGNFPSSQAVTGTVSVGNFPSSQAVTGTVSVGNFPSSQAVTGSVAITGTASVADSALLSAVNSPIAPQTGTGQDIGATENAAIGTTVVTSALASSLLIKNAAAKLSSAYVTSTAAGKLAIVDAASVPSSGATIAPKECVDVPANTPTGVSFSGLPPEPYATGIVALFTTGGCFLYTPSATAFIHGVWQ